MDKEEEKKIFFDNYKRINEMIEVRVKQVQDYSGFNWYSVLIEDELYKHLIKMLVELRQSATEHWGVDWAKQFPKGIYESLSITK